MQSSLQQRDGCGMAYIDSLNNDVKRNLLVKEIVNNGSACSAAATVQNAEPLFEDLIRECNDNRNHCLQLEQDLDREKEQVMRAYDEKKARLHQAAERYDAEGKKYLRDVETKHTKVLFLLHAHSHSITHEKATAASVEIMLKHEHPGSHTIPDLAQVGRPFENACDNAKKVFGVYHVDDIFELSQESKPVLDQVLKELHSAGHHKHHDFRHFIRELKDRVSDGGTHAPILPRTFNDKVIRFSDKGSLLLQKLLVSLYLQLTGYEEKCKEHADTLARAV